MRVLAICLLFLLVDFSSESLASCFGKKGASSDEQPPHVVYRADFLEPEANIFKNGFTRSGTNTDLIAHYKGDSCSYKAGTSAFVSTTSEQAVAAHYAKALLDSNLNKGAAQPKQYIYVYTIRATDNFYNLRNSLLNEFRRTRKEQYRQNADRCCADYEWIAYQRIPANQIKSATRYQKDPNNPMKAIAVDKPIDNPLYKRNPSSRGNSAPFQS